MLTNPRDAFRGQSRSPNMIPFDMLVYGFLLAFFMSLTRAGFQVFDFKKCRDLIIRIKGNSRSFNWNRHGSIRHLWLPINVNRLRIGHTRCTHSYLLSGADQPDCTTCQCPLTVKHILVECSDFIDTRNKHFVASSMEELFRTADVSNILDFIKETHFTVSYYIYKHFYSSYLALFLLHF